MRQLIEPLGVISERKDSLDRDIPEVAQLFGAETSHASVGDQHQEFARLGGFRMDPIREPFIVADERLQSRLQALCDALRVRY